MLYNTIKVFRMLSYIMQPKAKAKYASDSKNDTSHELFCTDVLFLSSGSLYVLHIDQIICFLPETFSSPISHLASSVTSSNERPPFIPSSQQAKNKSDAKLSLPGFH
mmetsp:Transcript_26738/g.30871  ORF Transcript_26738/g.30871 Transcript_26738/m.30871 type:complete len:107 (-) Transcript_26738:189-509(-)